MPRATPFLKKTYKIFSVIIFTLLFFIFYNVYLVDRAIVNLRIALVKATKEVKTVEDFKQIKSLLNLPILEEISKISTSGKFLIYLEMADNIAQVPQALGQIEEVKFYLKAIIEAREAGRSAILSILDKLNSYIFAPLVKISESQLKEKAKVLSTRIKLKQDKDLQQRLYYDLGNVYLELADLSRAKAAYLEAIEIDPRNNLGLKAKFNLAWTHKYMQSYDQAIAYFDEIYTHYPTRIIAILSQYQIANIFYKKGEYEKARDKYAELAEDYPEFEAVDLALFEAGYISFYNFNDAQTASGYFSELEEKFSQREIAKHVVANIRKTMATTRVQGGYELLGTKNYPEAIVNFEKALEVAPCDGRSQAGIGLALYWQGKKELAVEKAKKAIELSPDDEVTWINSSFIFINSGKTDEAIKLGEKTLPQGSIKRPEFYYNLGYAYILNAQMREAAFNLERTIEINPDFIFAYNNLGCSLWATKDYAEAIRRFKEAIDIDPEYTDARFNLGLVYFYLNQLEKAYKEFEKVAQIEPGYKGTEEYLRVIAQILNYKP